MLGLTEAFITIAAVIMTCRIAGRIPAMMLTAVAAAAGAIIMPPFASWEVESTADILTIVFQSIVGLAVAYKWQPKVQRLQAAEAIPFSQHQKGPVSSLFTIVPTVMARHQELTGRLCDIQFCGLLHGSIGTTEDELENILLDVLRLAFSDPKTQGIKIYTGRRPALHQIVLVAEYKAAVSLPRLRLLGRSDSQHPLETKHWPDNCSATIFDSPIARTYQISIREIRGN
jgi:hypothetical protein